MANTELTFWDHLEELRHVLFRIAIAVIALMILAFFFKETLFDIILAPKQSDFVTYQFFSWIAQEVDMPSIRPDDFNIPLINTQLASQFFIHMNAAFYAGLIISSPYVIYQLFRFVSPALYDNEKKYSIRVVAWGYILFMAGVLLNYFVIFPLTFRFLGTYQVSPQVENIITLTSYMDTLMMLSMMMGIVFELPILCWLFAKLGFINSAFMRRYRRHAIVIILIIAAIITPTSDVFTLLMVATPIYVLYELSIAVVKHSGSKEK